MATIDEITTALSALRLELIRDAGLCGALAASGHRDADALRRGGYHDFAVAAEQRANEAEQIGMRLADVLQSIGRIFGDPVPRHRTGEWKPLVETNMNEK